VKVAEILVPFIEDGSTLRLGIGSMPNVVGSILAQSDVKDLGMHTELCGDAYYELYKAGKLTNKRKTFRPGKGVTGIVFGSKALYDWVDRNPGVIIEPLEYVNAAETIARQHKMISINNCISVDLYGQVNAESAGLRHISGTGGQLDYLTGAAMARGGKAFICMTSTYVDKNGVRRSRVVPYFNGEIITNPRSQSYYMVTEYCAVNLTGRTTWERAEMLVSIAHPDFRDELIRAAEKQKIWRRSNRR
jgi:acyl-CoA hydrolase